MFRKLAAVALIGSALIVPKTVSAGFFAVSECKAVDGVGTYRVSQQYGNTLGVATQVQTWHHSTFNSGRVDSWSTLLQNNHTVFHATLHIPSSDTFVRQVGSLMTSFPVSGIRSC